VSSGSDSHQVVGIVEKLLQLRLRVIAGLLAMLLHLGVLLLLLGMATQTQLILPEIPIQVSLIKAEENIPNVPLEEPKKSQQKIIPRKKPIVKKKIPVVEAHLAATEPVSQPEALVEDDAVVTEPEPITTSEPEASEDSLPPLYEPPKFGVSYLNNPPPIYPAEAKRKKQHGVVLLKVLVATSGKPEHIEISESAGLQSLDQSALNAVKNWTFIPAKIGQELIAAYVIVPIRFNLERK
jgi:periplasmic protein TonB